MGLFSSIGKAVGGFVGKVTDVVKGVGKAIGNGLSSIGKVVGNALSNMAITKVLKMLVTKPLDLFKNPALLLNAAMEVYSLGAAGHIKALQEGLKALNPAMQALRKYQSAINLVQDPASLITGGGACFGIGSPLGTAGLAKLNSAERLYSALQNPGNMLSNPSAVEGLLGNGSGFCKSWGLKHWGGVMSDTQAAMGRSKPIRQYQSGMEIMNALHLI